MTNKFSKNVNNKNFFFATPKKVSNETINIINDLDPIDLKALKDITINNSELRSILTDALDQKRTMTNAF